MIRCGLFAVNANDVGLQRDKALLRVTLECCDVCLLILLIMEAVEVEKLLCLPEKLEDSIAPSRWYHCVWIEGAVQGRV